MKLCFKVFVLMFVTLLVCGVGFAQSVSVDWDHGVTNFSSFKTYAWVKSSRPTPNPLMDQRIVTAIDGQLAAKGLSKVEGPADLLVTYGAGVSEERSAMATGMGGWRMGGGMATINQSLTNVGTLVVDLDNGKTKKLMWRGAAKETISNKPDTNSKNIEKAVAKMFKKYPPSAK